jgi:sec-independent protein translocase protein TatB
LPLFWLWQYDGRMSFSETVFLFFLALIIFGPKKLPEIARQVGKILNEFRRASNEFKSQIEQEISHLELENRKQTIQPPTAAAPQGTTSRALASGGELGPVPTTASATSAAAPAAPSPSAQSANDEPGFASTAEKPEPNTTTLHSSGISSTPGLSTGPAVPPLPTTELSSPEPVTSSTSQESHA